MSELDLLAGARPNLQKMAEQTMSPAERTKLIDSIVATSGGGRAGRGAALAQLNSSTARRPWRRPTLLRTRLIRLAACVTLLAAVMAVVSTARLGGHRPAANAEAGTVLRQAAAALAGASQDPRIPAGRYLVITEHIRDMIFAPAPDGDSQNFAYVKTQTVRTWQPADPTETWLRSIGPSRTVQWLLGTAAEARAHGLDVGSPGQARTRTAPCGDFYAVDNREVPCHSKPIWGSPSSLDSLPRDPDALFDRLRHEVPRFGPGGSEIFTYLADALSTGLVSADLRAAFYEVMARLPGVAMTERSATLDGLRGTALGINTGTERKDVIIDPDTGRFIGERRISTIAEGGVPEGTVEYATSITDRVVSEIGDTK